VKHVIKNRWTGALMHEGEAETFKAFVEALCADAANLSDADLSDADLRRADLRRRRLETPPT
jgi:uncharacterized protein YjbI with pentapeptide repeats